MKIRPLVIAIIIITAALVVYSVRTATHKRTHVQSSMLTVKRQIFYYKTINDVESVSRNMELQVGKYLLTGRDSSRQNYTALKDSLNRITQRLQANDSNDLIPVTSINSLTENVQHEIGYLDSAVSKYPTERDRALDIFESPKARALGERVRLNVINLHELIQNDLDTQINKINDSAKNAYSWWLVITISAFIVLTAFLWRLQLENALRKKAQNAAGVNESKFRGLVENTSIVIFNADIDGNFTFVSDKAIDLTGYQKSEILGMHFTFLIPEEWKKKVENFYKEQFARLYYETYYQFPIVTKGGAIKWVDQDTLLLKDGDNITGFQAILQDVTALKAKEERLDEADKELKQKLKSRLEEYQFRLQAILDNIPMVVYVKDLDGKFSVINKCFSDLYGYTAESLIGKTTEAIADSKQNLEKYAQTDQEVIVTHKAVEFEELVSTSKGKKHMLTTKFPLFDNNSQLFAICGIDKDITEMVEFRQQLINAKIKAENAEKSQEEFLANMSHEIRTPMNGVIGMTSLLMSTNLDHTQKEYVQIIQQSSEILLILINDILDLSKIKAGRMDIEEIDFSVKDVMYSVLLPVNLKLDNKEVSVSNYVDDGVPTYVKGDLHKLVQIFNNLLSNAAKFTNRGKIEIAAKLLGISEGLVNVEFRVSDTGIGIAPPHLDTIFDSFSQAGTDMVRRFGGTGLGLSIVKKLIELLGGNISVESELGRGTTFKFTLPFKQSDVLESDVLLTTDTDIIYKEQGLAGKKVLVVEDNIVNQKVVTSMLVNLKLVCDIAANGKEAVRLLEAGNTYDIILMDLQMPEMNGFQTTTYIREKLKLTTPIIAMTASALRNERVKCFDMGMNAYLTKPFEAAWLIHYLYQLISPGKEEAFVEPVREKAEGKSYSLDFVNQIDDKESRNEILNLFIDNVPLLLQKLRTTTENENWEQVYKVAHELKSPIGILKVQKILEACNRIELDVKHRTNLDEILTIVKQMEQDYNLIRPMIESEITV